MMASHGMPAPAAFRTRPQALATCLVVVAPAATASATVWLVIPLHRQTNMVPNRVLIEPHQMCEAPDEDRRVGSDTGTRHPLGHRVGVVDPAAGILLGVDLLEHHRFVLVVEGPEQPQVPDSGVREAWSVARIREISVGRSSTLAIVAMMTPARRAGRGRTPRSSTVSPAKMAGMSRRPTESNQSRKIRDRNTSRIGSLLRSDMVTITRPASRVDT